MWLELVDSTGDVILREPDVVPPIPGSHVHYEGRVYRVDNNAYGTVLRFSTHPEFSPRLEATYRVLVWPL